MKGLTRLALIAVAAVGMGLAASAPSWAIHRGAGGLVCGGCHTMHNSQGRTTLDGLATDVSGADATATKGSLILLRASVSSRAEIHNLCLQCHSSTGSRGGDVHAPHAHTAPKVLLDTTLSWTQDTSFNRIGAGGDFSYAATTGTTGTSATTWTFEAGDALGKGHSLGATNVMPPGSADAALDYLTCTNCHDPHGVISSNTASLIANPYRMLRKGPTGSGGGTTPDSQATVIAGTVSYIGGITGEWTASPDKYIPIDAADGSTGISGTTDARKGIWPMFKGTMTATGVNTSGAAADSPNSNYYSSDIANWCAACHDNWHESNDTSNNAGGQNGKGDWKRHPVNNVVLEQACTSAGTEKTCSGAGVPIIDSSFPNYNPSVAGQAVPVVSGAGSDKTWYMQAAGSDKVFCLSCHFPHGGPYYDLLRWDYLAGGTDAPSAGVQKGNAIDATRGCQLCHNRGGM
ncbi:MAG: hypothetical protein HY887_05915 [Deltaproteobacteria bacterium]|nr:hypothetical protein [Deltaproteobacteria bacterium]